MGFENFHIKFSDRPEKRVGSDSVWNKAEKALTSATNAAGWDYSLNQGEGAFYGPKLEFVLTDAIGRDWQCGTLQVDFVLPERLDANFINENGDKERPVILHRAILGSFERFIGIMIEQYAGKLPLWLAPKQIVVASIKTDANPFVEEVTHLLMTEGLRVIADKRNEKIGYKIREHSLSKVPIILSVGEKEIISKTVNIRRLGNKHTETLAIKEAITMLKNESFPPDQRC